MKVEKGLRFDFRGGANLKVESLTWKINSYKTRGFATWRALGGRFSFEVWKGAIVAGLTHFVAAALPKLPICALKLGDRTSNSDDLRGLPQGFRRARSLSVAPPPVRFAVRALFSPGLERGHRRGAHAFCGGGAPKISYMRPQARRQDF